MNARPSIDFKSVARYDEHKKLDVAATLGEIVKQKINQRITASLDLKVEQKGDKKLEGRLRVDCDPDRIFFVSSDDPEDDFTALSRLIPLEKKQVAVNGQSKKNEASVSIGHFTKNYIIFDREFVLPYLKDFKREGIDQHPLLHLACFKLQKVFEAHNEKLRCAPDKTLYLSDEEEEFVIFPLADGRNLSLMDYIGSVDADKKQGLLYLIPSDKFYQILGDFKKYKQVEKATRDLLKKAEEKSSLTQLLHACKRGDFSKVAASFASDKFLYSPERRCDRFHEEVDKGMYSAEVLLWTIAIGVDDPHVRKLFEVLFFHTLVFNSPKLKEENGHFSSIMVPVVSVEVTDKALLETITSAYQKADEEFFSKCAELTQAQFKDFQKRYLRQAEEVLDDVEKYLAGEKVEFLQTEYLIYVMECLGQNHFLEAKLPEKSDRNFRQRIGSLRELAVMRANKSIVVDLDKLFEPQSDQQSKKAVASANDYFKIHLKHRYVSRIFNHVVKVIDDFNELHKQDDFLPSLFEDIRQKIVSSIINIFSSINNFAFYLHPPTRFQFPNTIDRDLLEPEPRVQSFIDSDSPADIVLPRFVTAIVIFGDTQLLAIVIAELKRENVNLSDSRSNLISEVLASEVDQVTKEANIKLLMEAGCERPNPMPAGIPQHLIDFIDRCDREYAAGMMGALSSGLSVDAAGIVVGYAGRPVPERKTFPITSSLSGTHEEKKGAGSVLAALDDALNEIKKSNTETTLISNIQQWALKNINYMVKVEIKNKPSHTSKATTEERRSQAEFAAFISQFKIAYAAIGAEANAVTLQKIKDELSRLFGHSGCSTMMQEELKTVVEKIEAFISLKPVVSLSSH